MTRIERTSDDSASAAQERVVADGQDETTGPADDRAWASRPRARIVIGTFASYGEAERAVDSLSDRKFPVERLAIDAEDLSFVEQVTGRLGWARAGMNGAATGALVGALFGWFAGILNWIQPLVAALTLTFYGLLLGALIGFVIGAAFHAIAGRGRDFSSTGSFTAERYDVVSDEEVAEAARRLLDERLAAT